MVMKKLNSDYFRNRNYKKHTKFCTDPDVEIKLFNETSVVYKNYMTFI